MQRKDSRREEGGYDDREAKRPTQPLLWTNSQMWRRPLSAEHVRTREHTARR